MVHDIGRMSLKTSCRTITRQQVLEIKRKNYLIIPFKASANQRQAFCHMFHSAVNGSKSLCHESLHFILQSYMKQIDGMYIPVCKLWYQKRSLSTRATLFHWAKARKITSLIIWQKQMWKLVTHTARKNSYKNLKGNEKK